MTLIAVPLPYRTKKSRLTPRAKRRMKMVLAWRKNGKTLEWIGRKLKVTRERVRQIQKLAEYRR